MTQRRRQQGKAVVTLNVSTALFHPPRSANYAAVPKQPCTLLCSYRDLCLIRDGPLTRALGIHDHHPAQHLDRRLAVLELDLSMFTLSTQRVGHHLGGRLDRHFVKCCRHFWKGSDYGSTIR
jgi:hypothetical protein